VHPRAVGIAAESFNKVHAGCSIDALIALPLDEGFSHTVKSAFIIFFNLSHMSSPFYLYEFWVPTPGLLPAFCFILRAVYRMRASTDIPILHKMVFFCLK
jgi:hypothetical protein